MTDRYSPDSAEAIHYLSAIKVRLELLYEHSIQDARLLEHLSDEVDWVDAEIERLRVCAQRAEDSDDWKALAWDKVAEAHKVRRAKTIEECARELEKSYPDHAWLNAACAAIRSLSISSTDRNWTERAAREWQLRMRMLRMRP